MTGIPTSFYSRHKAAVERDPRPFEGAHPELRVVRLRPGLIFQRDAATRSGGCSPARSCPRRSCAAGWCPSCPRHPRLRFQARARRRRRRRLPPRDHTRARAFNVAAEPVLDGDSRRLLGARPVPVPGGVLRGRRAAWRARLQPTEPGWVDHALPSRSWTRRGRGAGWAAGRPATRSSSCSTACATARAPRLRRSTRRPAVRRATSCRRSAALAVARARRRPRCRSRQGPYPADTGMHRPAATSRAAPTASGWFARSTGGRWRTRSSGSSSSTWRSSTSRRTSRGSRRSGRRSCSARESYSGGAFRPHAELHAKVRLREGHFTRWLNLWSRTVDELFAGERAELAKAHAHRVAQAFLGRLQTLLVANDIRPAPAGLTVTRTRRPGLRPAARSGSPSRPATAPRPAELPRRGPHPTALSPR